MVSAREHLSNSGFEGARLWVMDRNDRARRFYELDGWRVDGAARVDTIGDMTVSEVRYRRDLG